MIRSASTVCSFAMKYFGWSLTRALSHTKVNQNIPLCFLWNLACADVILPLFVYRREDLLSTQTRDFGNSFEYTKESWRQANHICCTIAIMSQNPSTTDSHNQASRQRNSFKEIKRSKSEGSMKRSPTLMRMRSRRGRGHSRQGSAGGSSLQRVRVSKVFAERLFTCPGVEAGCEGGEGRPRRAASWSPAQPVEGGGDQEGRHHPARPGQIIRL